MYRLAWCVLLLARLGAAKEMTEIESISVRPRFCSYERAYDMYGAHCANLNLAKVPRLRGGIEILDFSKNRLRKVDSDTFSDYGSIKFLYLSENYIRHVAADAFLYLTDLRTLDLSINALSHVPDTLFQLPALRKLYLSGNSLIYLDSEYTAISKPIKAPLELIDISDCEMRGVPNLGYLPQLVVYNISRNPLTSMNARLFAQACNLAKLDISGSIEKIPLCDLRSSISWFEEKHISFKLDDYTRLNSREFEECALTETVAMLNATHHRCKSQYLQVQTMKASSRSMYTIVGGLAGFLVGFILLLYVSHRVNVARSRRGKPAPPDHLAGKTLLNNAA